MSVIVCLSLFSLIFILIKININYIKLLHSHICYCYAEKKFVVKKV